MNQPAESRDPLQNWNWVLLAPLVIAVLVFATAVSAQRRGPAPQRWSPHRTVFKHLAVRWLQPPEIRVRTVSRRGNGLRFSVDRQGRVLGEMELRVPPVSAAELSDTEAACRLGRGVKFLPGKRASLQYRLHRPGDAELEDLFHRIVESARVEPLSP